MRHLPTSVALAHTKDISLARHENYLIVYLGREAA